MKLFILKVTSVMALTMGSIVAVEGAETASGASVDSAVESADFLPVFRSQVGMAARRSGPGASYRSTEGTSSYNCNNSTPGGDRIIRYPFTAPDNRVLDSVRVWGVKGVNTQDLGLAAYRSCMSQSDVLPTTQQLGSVTLTSTGGQFVSTLNLADEAPLNLDCKYWLEVTFGSSAAACALSNTNLRIYKMRVQSLRLDPDPIFRDRFSNDPLN